MQQKKKQTIFLSVYGSVAPDYIPMCRRRADYGPSDVSEGHYLLTLWLWNKIFSTNTSRLGGLTQKSATRPWQVFNEEIHQNRCSLVIFLTVAIPAAFRGSDWNSLPGALHTHTTLHGWLAPPLIKSVTKKKKNDPHFPIAAGIYDVTKLYFQITAITQPQASSEKSLLRGTIRLGVT